MKAIGYGLCAAIIIFTTGSDAEAPPERTWPLRFESQALPEGVPGQLEIPEHPGRQALFAAADEYTRLVTRALQKLGTVDGAGFRGLESDDIYTRGFTRSLPAANFRPELLGSIAKEALSDWLDFHLCPSRAIGGGGSRYSVSIGDQTSRAFIDLFAYRDGEKVNVEFQIRAVRMKAP